MLASDYEMAVVFMISQHLVVTCENSMHNQDIENCSMN